MGRRKSGVGCAKLHQKSGEVFQKVPCFITTREPYRTARHCIIRFPQKLRMACVSAVSEGYVEGKAEM